MRDVQVVGWVRLDRWPHTVLLERLQSIPDRHQLAATGAGRRGFKRAMQGSDAMLSHLGKSVLGQTYKLDVTTKGTPTVVYFERAHKPRDAELKRPDGSVFHPGHPDLRHALGHDILERGTWTGRRQPPNARPTEELKS